MSKTHRKAVDVMACLLRLREETARAAAPGARDGLIRIIDETLREFAGYQDELESRMSGLLTGERTHLGGKGRPPLQLRMRGVM